MKKPGEKRELYATEMEYGQFLDWATGWILIGLGSGDKLRHLVGTVVDHALRNEIFGKESKK